MGPGACCCSAFDPVGPANLAWPASAACPPPALQMKLAINAVFGSWNTPRAVKYRSGPDSTSLLGGCTQVPAAATPAPRLAELCHYPPPACREINRIRGLLGTAVNVQSMVYGNLNDNSGTGACGPPGTGPAQRLERARGKASQHAGAAASSPARVPLHLPALSVARPLWSPPACRRVLHAQPRHRREAAVRRVPAQRAGRGCGGRHPHAAGRGAREQLGGRRGRKREGFGSACVMAAVHAASAPEPILAEPPPPEVRLLLLALPQPSDSTLCPPPLGSADGRQLPRRLRRPGGQHHPAGEAHARHAGKAGARLAR